MTPPIRIEVSPGELLDRISILTLKLRHLADSPGRQGVQAELDRLLEVRDRAIAFTEELHTLAEELAAANGTLWQLEDELRLCEQRGTFDARFIELARGVYQTNDRRSLLKRRINELLRSCLVERKVYSSG